MARLLVAADPALDDPFVGLADISVPVATALREAAYEALEQLMALATEQAVGVVVLIGDLAHRGGAVRPGLRRLRSVLERWHEATGGHVACVPAGDDATSAWQGRDAPAGVVVLEQDAASWGIPAVDGVDLALRRRGGEPGVDVFRTSDVIDGVSRLLTVTRAARSIITRDGQGAVAITLAPLQARVALPVDQPVGVALVDLEAGRSVEVEAGLVTLERIRIVDRTIRVAPASPGHSPTGAAQRVAQALRDDARAVADLLPGRLVIARAAVDGDPGIRRLLALPGTTRAALQDVRIATASAEVPVWWERVDVVPSPPAPATDGVDVDANDPLPRAVRQLVGELLGSHQQLDDAATVVERAVGTLRTDLPFDLALTDSGTVQAAADLLVDLLGTTEPTVATGTSGPSGDTRTAGVSA